MSPVVSLRRRPANAKCVEHMLQVCATGRRGSFMAVAVVMQVTLGIVTLLSAVPVPLGVLHQLSGVGVLTAVVVAAHRARESVQIAG